MPETGINNPPTPEVEAAPVTEAKEVKEEKITPKDDSAPKTGLTSKQKKIILTLVIVSVGILALITGTIGVILIVNNANSQNGANDQSSSSSVSFTATSDTSSESVSSHTLNADGTMDLDIDFSDPELLAEDMSVFAAVEGNEYAYDPDSDDPYDVYRLGTVLAGILSVPTDEGLLDVQGYGYYVAFRPGYFSIDMGDVPSMIHFLKENDDSGSWIVIDRYAYGFIDATLFQSEVPFLMPNEVSRGVTELMIPLPVDDSMATYFLSDEWVNYSSYGSIYPEFASDVDKQQLDTIDSVPVYQSTDDPAKIFIVTRDGFVSPIAMIPTLIVGDNTISSDVYTASIPQVTWEDGTTNTSPYDYISIGGCGFLFGLEVVNDEISIWDLTEVGVDADGNPVYIQTQADNEYETKLYNEDYIAFDYYMYNDLTDDDVTPFTYEEFRAQHPVIYWEDEYGNIIRFASRSYVMTGGCAKPIAYLYPTETTDFSLSVVANGQVTFTYPRTGSDITWTGVASPDGTISIDGQDYPYLWWESRKDGALSTPKEQVVVSRGQLQGFLTDSLTRLGLNATERKDFSDFWVPKMMSSESRYFKVGFLVDHEVDQIASLEIAPTPETIRRVFMVYAPIDTPISVNEEKVGHVLSIDDYLHTLPSLVRTGFTVIEWGGALQ